MPHTCSNNPAYEWINGGHILAGWCGVAGPPAALIVTVLNAKYWKCFLSFILATAQRSSIACWLAVRMAEWRYSSSFPLAKTLLHFIFYFFPFTWSWRSCNVGGDGVVIVGGDGDGDVMLCLFGVKMNGIGSNFFRLSFAGMIVGWWFMLILDTGFRPLAVGWLVFSNVCFFRFVFAWPLSYSLFIFPFSTLFIFFQETKFWVTLELGRLVDDGHLFVCSNQLLLVEVFSVPPSSTFSIAYVLGLMKVILSYNPG